MAAPQFRLGSRSLLWVLLFGGFWAGLFLPTELETVGHAQEQPAAAETDAAQAEKPVAKPAADPQPNPPNEPKKTPLARYVVVKSPVDDQVFRSVRNTALKLQELATTENRPALLFLEIRPGQSEFHQVLGLAQFLSSTKVSRLKTIAWIPETVTGNNVILALGCQEIVMQPDASLGDIGLGKPVDATEEQSILALVNKRHNVQVNNDLALGLLNPQVALLQLTLERDGATEKRVVTEQQARVLRENELAISDVEEIKAAGQRGIFSGQQARQLGILVSQTANTQAELADLYRIDPLSLKEQIGYEAATVVRMIDVTDGIDPVLESFLERQITRSVAEGAKIIIFRITSPGGRLLSGMNLADRIADLEEQGVRTIAWIPEHAISSAAITALGCDEIYLGRNAQIGDAGVIMPRFDGAFENVPEKILSPLREMLRSLAIRKHRPPAILEAMSFKDLEVFQVTNRETGRLWFMTDEELRNAKEEWIKGPLVRESKKGILLTLQDQRAVDLKIASAVVADLDELKERLNIPPEVALNAVGRTWVDALVFVLNDPFVTGLLFFVAIICIYIELHFMIGIFGILSALCFGIFFWSRYLGGTATGLEVLIFFLGVICVLTEIFLVPGFGVFGISGMLLILLSLILASESFSAAEPIFQPDKVLRVLTMVGLPMLAVLISSMFISKYLPQIPILKHMVLTPPVRKHAGDTESLQLRPDLVEQHAGALIPGTQGISVTILRPAGKARFGDQVVDVVTEGVFLAQETPLEIVESRGNRIVVRQSFEDSEMS